MKSFKLTGLYTCDIDYNYRSCHDVINDRLILLKENKRFK